MPGLRANRQPSGASAINSVCGADDPTDAVWVTGHRDHSRMRTVVDAMIASATSGRGTLTVLGPTGEPADTVTWHDLHVRARRQAAALAGLGVRPGDRVGLLGDSGVPMVSAVQAVWLAGGATTVLPPRGRCGIEAYLEQLRAIVADAGMTAILVDEPAGEVAAGLAGVTRVLDLTVSAGTPAEPYRPEPTDLAVLQYTSGSTRSPRGVPVTHGHFAANLDAIADALDHDEWHPGVWLSWLPLYHDMGLIAFLTHPMTCGCPLVLQSPAGFAGHPASWLGAMSRYRATISGAPNFAYALMTRLLAGRTDLDLDLRATRLLVSGGEPVDAEMMTRFAAEAGRYGLDPAALTPAYGLAETTLAATMNPAGAGLRVDRVDPHALESGGRAVPVPGSAPGRTLVSCGRPVARTSVRIVDRHTGTPVGTRAIGHIELRGASVVGHYWGEPKPPVDSWLRTGDLGYLTHGGELVVCGREKDVVFAAGRNIFPQDVEAVAQEAPGVRPGGAAAFGLADERGDRLVVAVEARGGDPAELRRSVTALVRAEVGLAPAEVVVLPYGQLPKTTSGKLRRAETRRRYLDGQLAAAAR